MLLKGTTKYQFMENILRSDFVNVVQTELHLTLGPQLMSFPHVFSED